MITSDSTEEARIGILKKYWGHQSFRPLQEEIVASVIAGVDTVALLPTGGGKSVCFQVPAMLRAGVCIVVSPLIALMRDQVDQLRKKGIKAIAINATLTKREIDIALDNAVFGDTKFLYLSPERLLSEIVQVRLRKMKVSLIAVDEAHCISEWGHEFRPAYRQIATLRKLLPEVPIIALTATATNTVLGDIVQQLELRKPKIFTNSFARDNLIYVVQNENFKLNRICTIARKMQGSGIVYVSTRRDTMRYAQLLRANNIRAVAYHGGMDYKVRSEAQDLWIKDQAQVVVATNAFGMGIDKPNVRFVIHLQLPPTVEGYFQEAGRAGRDGKLSYAVALVQPIDVADMRERVLSAIPTEQDISLAYKSLANHYQIATGITNGQAYPFDISTFAKKWGLSAPKMAGALKFLEWAEYINLSEAVFTPSKIFSPMAAKDLYSFIIGNPRFEKLLHLIMRSYEGLFDYPIPISENNLATKLGVAPDDVKGMLTQLAEFRVLRYELQSELPLLQFNGQRVHSDALTIDKTRLASQRRRILGGLDYMEQYAKNDFLCRSRNLLKYFGEFDTKACGKCDVCLIQRKIGLTNKKFETILAILQSNQNESDRISALQTFLPNEISAVERWIKENGV